MMKKLVCGCFGNIYYATILKDGIMSDKDRVEVTDDALTSVLYHLTDTQGYRDKGFGGYEYLNKNKTKWTTLCAFDSDKYVVVDKKVYEEMKQSKKYKEI